MQYGDDDIWNQHNNSITAKADVVDVEKICDLKPGDLIKHKKSPQEMGNILDPTCEKLGAKHDQGKLLFGCLTQGLAPVLKGVAAILTFGAQKYNRDSWQSVPNAKQRYHDAMERHLNAYNSGENFDTESGLHHMLHMICCAMFVMWFEMEPYPDADFTKFNKLEKSGKCGDYDKCSNCALRAELTKAKAMIEECKEE